MKKIYLPILFLIALCSANLSGQVTFTVADDQTCGATLTVPVTVSSFTNLTAFQYSMEWDETVLEFVSVSNFNLTDLDNNDFGTNNTNSLLESQTVEIPCWRTKQ